MPDALNQVSGSIGGPIVKDKTFFFAAADYTRQDRTTFLSPTPLRSAAGGRRIYVGNYRQALVNARLDHKLNAAQTLMVRVNVDRFYDTNPKDAVSGNGAERARRYTRRSWTARSTTRRSSRRELLNEARFAYPERRPGDALGAACRCRPRTRAPDRCRSRSASRARRTSSATRSQFSDTLSWSQRPALRCASAAASRTHVGRHRQRAGQRVHARHVHVPEPDDRPPFDQLTLADVQQYTQPISFGITSYELKQWLSAVFAQDSFRVSNDLTLDLGLRYDRQTLTDATKNFAPRVGFGWHPSGDPGPAMRGGYGMYYTQIRANAVAGFVLGGLDGLITYTATPGQTGLPDLPDGRACRCRSIRERCRCRSCRRATSRSAPGSAFYYAQFCDID